MSASQGASDSTQVVELQFTLLRAFNLPGSRAGLSKYFATLETSPGRTDRTHQTKGKNPEWNKVFLCDVQTAFPTLSLNIFRIGLLGQTELVARAFPNVATCLHPPPTDILDKPCPLLSPTDNNTPLGKATIFYSCTHSGRPAAVMTSPALQKLVHGEEDLISKLNPPNDPGLSTAVTFAASDVTQHICTILGKIDRVGQAIAEVHPYAKVAWNVLNAAQRIVSAQINRDDRVCRIWNRIGDILDLVDPLGKYKDHRMYKKNVEAILKQVYECVLFLRWYADKGFAVRSFRDALSDRAENAIQGFEKAFQDLWKSLQDTISIDTIEQTYRIVAATERIAEIAVDVHLDRLPGATLSNVEYDTQKACLPGTRKDLLKHISEWIHTPSSSSSSRILWLTGPAGTGKSRVANSIAHHMDSLGRLAASFRFDRAQAAERKPGVLIGNLCRQLARFDGALGGAILEAVGRYGPGGSMPCRSQAVKLFVGPMGRVELVGPVVIVIDALDESGNCDGGVQGGGTSREDLVQTIVEEFIHLPPSVRVIITSREESWITNHMMSSSCKRLLITETPGVEADIEAFIENEINHIRKSKRRAADWPRREDVQSLIHHANKLFIWAAVACSFIKQGHNPDSQLREILDPTRPRPLTALGDLYMTVVEQGLQGITSEEEKNDWQRVVGTLLAVKTPLTVVEMDALLGLPTESLRTTGDFIDSLVPLLQQVDAERESPVRLLHKSVFDFLTTQRRVPMDVAVLHWAMAGDCLVFMNENLGYGMGWISTSGEPLPERCNPSALRYACRHFAKHLSDSLALEHVQCRDELGIFLMEHLMHWFEVMAWLKEVYVVEESLKLLLVCLQIFSGKQSGNPDKDKIDELLHIASDGISFLQNVRGVCTLSPMDIYRSGIAMSPKGSWIYKLYSSCVRTLPSVMTSSTLLWSRSLCVFEGHRESVTSVAFRRDGKVVVSGSSDNTVRLWDVERGEAIGAALEGHRSGVTSVVFSPDGKKVASGSWDHTVRLWDAEKGEAVGCALVGHLDGVMAVVFSPDGKKVASGSSDNTVRLWDVEKGEAIGSALEGHLDGVTSIVFSPDGKKVASGSFDRAVRLWDVERGEAIGDALKGHRVGVTSIAFSPDGKTVASGSSDNTVRLWDVERGEAIGAALEGHRSGVNSIVFSPDGKKVASGSFDSTVRLWDAEKGNVIGSALEGHRGGVTSVVFSPDGRKVASGSSDNSVRLWDVEKGEAIGSALEGHLDRVTSIVFSLDGKKVASGSSDNTVRLWDAEKGDEIGSALEGHRSGVTSIVFSPDGKKVASGSFDSTVLLWDAEKGKVIGSALEGHRSGVMSIVFSPDGKKVASGSFDRTVPLWDVEKGEAIGSALEGHLDGVMSIVFSPDGKKVASGSWDRTVRLWDVEKGEAVGPTFKGHRGGVTSIVFSPDGKKVASGSSDRTVRLWDAEKGEAIGSAVEEHRSGLTSIVFSPDGKKVASGSSDGTVRLWDAEKGEVIGSALKGHRDRVTSIVFSTDGQTIESTSSNGETHVWDAENGCSLDHPNNSTFKHVQHVQSNNSASIGPLTDKTPVSLFQLEVDDTGFLINGDKHRLLWIPAHLRGNKIAVHSSTRTVVMGGSSGAMMFICFLCDTL